MVYEHCKNCLNYDLNNRQCDLYEIVDGEEVHEKKEPDDNACEDFFELSPDSVELILDEMFQEISRKFNPSTYNLAFLDKYIFRLQKFDIEVDWR